MEYTRVHITTDEDGHNYVIPYNLKKEFNDLCEKAYSEDDFEDFTEKFGQYSIGGSLDLVELYMKTDKL